MKRSISIANIILSIVILFGGISYSILHSIPVKAFASAAFVALGLVNLVFALKNGSKNRAFTVVMFIGMVIAMVADIMLEIYFMTGAIIFAISHVFNFASYCTLAPFRWRDAIPGGIMFAVSCAVVLIPPIFDFGGNIMLIVCLVYALIISLMLGKAISNYRSDKCLLNLLLLVGSVLYFFSDMMLLFSHFSDAPGFVGKLCVNSYYIAQIFLAHSILRSQDESVKKLDA
ncbi:MAG: lysoplasmalogenase [Clostridia bacterium]|nr:lysoplasmalogenase [Clostridia bacterium]